MFPGSLFPANRRHGVALVIVLAFVVLLTGLVVAFFSRAVSERQISNSSANVTRVDLFAEGAAATVLGDLRQEIAAGSKITQPLPQPTTGAASLYLPSSPTTAVPCLARTTGTDTPSVLPNLLKRSAYNVPFFSGSAYSGNNPASNRAANSSSVTAAQNGRSISPARWNKSLLLPKQNSTSDSDLTPDTTNFKAPDWIVVARDGTNPRTWNAALVTSGTNAAVGRFAYNVYDEGGLLDANAAGYPTDASLPNAQGTTPAYNLPGNFPAYKRSLAFADLKQLPGISGLPADRQESVVRTLVGWRNYASAAIDLSASPALVGSPLTGNANTPPGYGWLSGNVLDYLRGVQVSNTGFLRTSNSLLVSGQSDRLFPSRQLFMNLMLNSVADQSAGKADERAGLQTAMQYLGTFSRALNQPSYTPAFPNDPSRPATQAVTGGNDFGSNNLSSTDDVINPTFLATRVQTTKIAGRNDGSDLLAGEPLVKKRFALNRLAWLTYLGPSADHMGEASVLATITALGGNPVNTSDPIYQFVAQGTAQNIYNYFGLSWVADPTGNGTSEWVYSHQGTAPLTSASGLAATPIKKLSVSATPDANSVTGREADFFELLRASTVLGSLAKAYTAEQPAPGQDGYTSTRAYQTVHDTSVDASVIQLGANIIDQCDSDGYPSRILFNNGLHGKTQEYRGIEDLPYLYRIREGKIRTVDAVVSSGASTIGYKDLPIVGGTLSNPGKCVMLQQPEIWNPHAWRGTYTADTAPRPQSLRIVALSEDPNGNGSGTLYPIKLNVEWRSAKNTGGTNTGHYDPPLTTVAPQKLTAETTEMLFSIPVGQNYLFREPTLLIKPGVPGGSNLRIGSNPNHWVAQLAGGTFFTSLDTAGNGGIGYPSGVTDNKSYIGFPLGGEMLPLAWTTSLDTGAIDGASNPATPSAGIVPAQYINLNSGTAITYRLQYEIPVGSGKWCTYDEKYAPIVYANSYNTWKLASQGGQERYAFTQNAIGTDLLVTGFDPRTSRFGLHFMGRNGRGNQGQLPPPDFWSGWTSAMAYQNALATNRPDEYQGYTFDSTAFPSGYSYDCGPSALGWYQTGMPATKSFSTRSGLMTQNNPAVASATSNLRVAGDGRGGYVGSSGLSGFTDPDGVMRRAMGAHVQPSATSAATITSGVSGQPLKTSYNYASNSNGFGTVASITDNGNASSRPVVLNRPFRSVAELGYTFGGTPWRNVDFFAPESGNAAMLDVFCVTDAGDSSSMVAGTINLNTRQAPVLQAIIAGAYRDENTISSTANLPATGTAAAADKIAAALVNRTASTAAGAGPLRNVSELVGKWVSSQSFSGAVAPFNVDGGTSYLGFLGTAATSSAPPSSPPNLSSLLYQEAQTTGVSTNQVAQRHRESAIRVLSASGQTRVWNLLIDLVAQTGRYSPTAATLDQFSVEGEQRCWIHLAIDRYTGEVIDKQIEIVKE